MINLTFYEVAAALLKGSYTFAKTMPEHPHHYTLRQNWQNDELFESVVQYMRDNSFTETFKKINYKMFPLNGDKYWTMGAPLKDTILINRASHVHHAPYDDIAAQYDTLWSGPSAEAEEAELFKKLEIRGHVLDIGCGTGMFLRHAFEFESYTGLDPSMKMIRICESELRKNQQQSNRSCIDELYNCKFENYYPGRRFDTIVALFGTASYIHPETLERVQDYLNPGGKAYLMFYKKGYQPQTHIKTGVHVEFVYTDRPGIQFRNYHVVTIMCKSADHK